VLGIRPWEIDLLAANEFDALCDYLDRREAQQAG
jgi:hypothetical protein